MKRIYEFITKANQVLLFLLVLGVLGFLGFFAYQESSNHYTPPQVPIAQTPEAMKRVVVEDVRWLGAVSGTYIFGIVKKEIAPAEQSERRLTMKMSKSYLGSGEDDDRGQIVNVIFSRDAQKVKTLLEADGLVIDSQLSGGYSAAEKFRAALFRCVTDDTDGNHLLDHKDRNDLYIVPHDMAKADIVIKGILDYDVVSETRLLTKTREKDGLHFIEINIETLEKKDVTWK